MSADLLTREQILAKATSPELPFEHVDIPDFGRVKVLGMSGTQRDAWESSLIVGKGKKRDVNTKNVRAKLAVRSLVDEANKRIFSDNDAEVLGQLPASVLNKIYEAAQRVSGVSDEDVDELGKSSGGEGGTDSPSN